MSGSECDVTPVPLWTLASLVRAKNAGPFTITIDIMFDDAGSYERVRTSGIIAKELIAQLYDVPLDTVHFTEHGAALALKVSFPRTVSSGGVGDTDVFGGQFHGPLVNILIP
jgi:hypothetical protein